VVVKEVGVMRCKHRSLTGLKGAGALFLVAAVAALLGSCTPETGLQTAEDYDVVVTLYDKEADYGSIRTYLMPDSIVHIDDPQNPGEPLTREYDELILERVEYNLQAIGYRKETDPEENDPDIIVMVSATTAQWTALNYSWLPRWGWWGQWPGATGDWYFQSPYYSGGSVYSFSTGTLLVDMGDIRDNDGDPEDMDGIWTAAMSGVVTGESAEAPQRLVDFIDRAFNQSPYLGAEE
jgi:hypothetical protein